MAKTVKLSGNNWRDGVHFARYTLIGFFTVAPLWVTWLVFDFLLGILAGAGTSLLLGASRVVAPFSSTLADWLRDSSFPRLVAVILTLDLYYDIGLLASFVVGRRLIELFKALFARLPLVQTVYGATKRFLQTLRQPSISGQRVVLISFPTPEMKAVGLVTRIVRDETGGRELAVVYVPTSPNPDFRLVPMSEVVQTDWGIEEAMSFVMTGGNNSPDSIPFTAGDGEEHR